jgi:hypothetical protein
MRQFLGPKCKIDQHGRYVVCSIESAVKYPTKDSLLVTGFFAWRSIFILKMEAIFSSETSGIFRTVQHYKPDDSTLQI